MNSLVAQLTHCSFPAVAAVIRAEAGQITEAWDGAVREAMPQMRGVAFDELKDSTPEILEAIADALASDDPEVIRDLVRCAPARRLSRFDLGLDVVEVLQEDRLLRALIVQRVEGGLGRRMGTDESAALHATIDVMLQRSVVALVERQEVRLRAAAETELKFLAYLSHDMNNHLSGVTMSLYALELELRRAGRFAAAEEGLALARRAIEETVDGMRRMLDHERLRHAGETRASGPVDLRDVAARVAAQFEREADAKGLALAVEVAPGTVVESDGELIAVVLQNLVGNAVKYSVRGRVCVGVEEGEGLGEDVVLWVSDRGPGIAADQLGHIFDAFKRGDVHGQVGVGLGLAIASQAARLLGARLSVASEPGEGSRFSLHLPCAGEAAAAAGTDGRGYQSREITP